MKKYNYVVCGCGKDYKELKKFYHLNDVIDRFDRVSFVKNVRHAGVMSLYNSAFYTCKLLQRKAIEDIQEVFSVDNLTKEYYNLKTDADKHQNTIGISIGSFSVEINYQKIYCGVHISFQLRNDKPQFVISYITSSACLHLSGESIESEDIDDFMSKIKDRTTELIGEMKELISEYSAFTPKSIKNEKEQKKRQREGIEAAKKRGVHMGRPAATEPDNFSEVYTKWKSGLITAKEAAKLTGLVPSTFYRLVNRREEKV